MPPTWELGGAFSWAEGTLMETAQPSQTRCRCSSPCSLLSNPSPSLTPSIQQLAGRGFLSSWHPLETEVRFCSCPWARLGWRGFAFGEGRWILGAVNSAPQDTSHLNPFLLCLENGGRTVTGQGRDFMHTLRHREVSVAAEIGGWVHLWCMSVTGAASTTWVSSGHTSSHKTWEG